MTKVCLTAAAIGAGLCLVAGVLLIGTLRTDRDAVVTASQMAFGVFALGIGSGLLLGCAAQARRM